MCSILFDSLLFYAILLYAPLCSSIPFGPRALGASSAAAVSALLSSFLFLSLRLRLLPSSPLFSFFHCVCDWSPPVRFVAFAVPLLRSSALPLFRAEIKGHELPTSGGRINTHVSQMDRTPFGLKLGQLRKGLGHRTRGILPRKLIYTRHKKH